MGGGEGGGCAWHLHFADGVLVSGPAGAVLVLVGQPAAAEDLRVGRPRPTSVAPTRQSSLAPPSSPGSTQQPTAGPLRRRRGMSGCAHPTAAAVRVRIPGARAHTGAHMRASSLALRSRHRRVLAPKPLPRPAPLEERDAEKGHRRSFPKRPHSSAPQSPADTPAPPHATAGAESRTVLFRPALVLRPSPLSPPPSLLRGGRVARPAHLEERDAEGVHVRRRRDPRSGQQLGRLPACEPEPSSAVCFEGHLCCG